MSHSAVEAIQNLAKYHIFSPPPSRRDLTNFFITVILPIIVVHVVIALIPSLNPNYYYGGVKLEAQVKNKLLTQPWIMPQPR